MFTLIFCFFFFSFGLDQVVPGCQSLPTKSQQKRPLQPILQHSSFSESPPHLPSPSSWQGVALPFPKTYVLPANTLHREVHSQGLWLLSTAMRKKISVLNKQNHKEQHASAPPPSQCTLFLSVSGNISGSLGLRYKQCITPYLP